MTTLHTDRGDQIMSSADYASAITCRRPPRWIRPLKHIGIALCIACTCWLLMGCSAPSAQQEAEYVAADVQDAITQAQMDAPGWRAK